MPTFLTPLIVWDWQEDELPPPVRHQRNRRRTEAHGQVTHNLPGRWRVANDALRGYELYRGQDASPDLTAAPWETFSSLPHETAALTVGADHHMVLRHRNEYNMVTKNIEETIIRVDGGGDEEPVPPSAPVHITITPTAAGAVNVRAFYNHVADGTNAATQFLVYLTSDGSVPTPGVDSPAVETMVKAHALAYLDYTSGTYADGLTIKTLVRARRVDAGPVNVDSTNTTIYSTTSDTDGAAAPVGAPYFDESWEG